MNRVFLIGSPRSGTTLLENILNCHPDIAELYEPYYLWEQFFNIKKSDIWDTNELTDDAIQKIRREFRIFSRKSQKPIVLDKSPAYVYNIPIVLKVFPNAKWIHIVRDGRDVSLSINKEWEKREQQVEKKDFYSLLTIARKMLARQPFLRFKWMALMYELKRTFSLNPYKYLNKSRWNGRVGWGPRFKNWKHYLDTQSTLEFNAMQWAASVESVANHWDLIEKDCKIEVRYETLLLKPKETITRILSLLKCKPSPDFFSEIPSLIPGNYNKWKKEFSLEQIEQISTIVSPMLKAFNYKV